MERRVALIETDDSTWLCDIRVTVRVHHSCADGA